MSHVTSAKTVALLSRADQANPNVVRARLGDVLQACLACRHPELGGAVVTTLRISACRAC